mmetsp:Transcript_15018/g.40360  ORF Transcript_15018/g.40360 Transcript_15018/m.40360 type:complete len:291 (-) Transcript_15018:155-1027(-)
MILLRCTTNYCMTGRSRQITAHESNTISVHGTFSHRTSPLRRDPTFSTGASRRGLVELRVQLGDLRVRLGGLYLRAGENLLRVNMLLVQFIIDRRVTGQHRTLHRHADACALRVAIRGHGIRRHDVINIIRLLEPEPHRPRRRVDIRADLELRLVVELLHRLLRVQREHIMHHLPPHLRPEPHPADRDDGGAGPRAVGELGDDEAGADGAGDERADFDEVHEDEALAVLEDLLGDDGRGARRGVGPHLDDFGGLAHVFEDVAGAAVSFHLGSGWVGGRRGRVREGWTKME